MIKIGLGESKFKRADFDEEVYKCFMDGIAKG